MKINVYPAIFEKEIDGYTVHFPDLSGCITFGDTITNSYVHAKECLRLFLDGMKDLPKPSSIENIIKANNDNIVLLVDTCGKDEILYFDSGDFSVRFNVALEKKGYTKYQVAKILGVDKAYIGRIAKGERSPSVEMAQRIAALLGIDWRIFYPAATNIKKDNKKIRTEVPKTVGKRYKQKQEKTDSAAHL